MSRRAEKLPRVEFGVPFRPFTEMGLKKAFKEVLGPYDPFDEYSRRINPVDKTEADLISKDFRLGERGRNVYTVQLLYRHPADLGNYPEDYFLPFPDKTGLDVSFPLGQNPEVKNIPVDVVVGRKSGPGRLRWVISLEGSDNLEGVFRTSGKLNDVKESGFIVGGQIKSMLLPADPKLLSTMELNFLPWQTVFNSSDLKQISDFQVPARTAQNSFDPQDSPIAISA